MEQRCIQLEGGLKKSQFELQQKCKQVNYLFVRSVIRSFFCDKRLIQLVGVVPVNCLGIGLGCVYT